MSARNRVSSTIRTEPSSSRSASRLARTRSSASVKAVASSTSCPTASARTDSGGEMR